MSLSPNTKEGVSRTRWIAQTGLYLALAIVLPIGFHAFGLAGRIFLPMHLPVLLAGFLVGPVSGLAAGLLAPGLSFLITGMPPTYAVPPMSLELPIYGLVAGLAYNRLRLNVYIALIAAMIVGRLMFALGLIVLGLFMHLPYTGAQFLSLSATGSLVAGWPGIAVQVVLIPLIVAAVRRARQ